MKYNKKGLGVRDLSPIILSLVVAMIILGAGLFISEEFRDEMPTTLDTASHEALTSVYNGTAKALANAWAQQSGSSAINVTGGESITGYLITSNITHSWFTLTDNTFNNTNINVTYNYEVPSLAYSKMTDSLEGLGKFGDWWALIIVVIIAALLIGMVITGLAGTRR